jgi:hypothetical protein
MYITPMLNAHTLHYEYAGLAEIAPI